MNSRLLVGVPVLVLAAALLHFSALEPPLLVHLTDSSRPVPRPSTTTQGHAVTVQPEYNSNSDPVPLPLLSPSPLVHQPSQSQQHDIIQYESETETELPSSSSAATLSVDITSTSLPLDLLTPQPSITIISIDNDDNPSPTTLSTIQTEKNNDVDDYATTATSAAELASSMSPEPEVSTEPPFLLTHDVSILQHPLVMNEDCRSRTRAELPPLLPPPSSMPSALSDYQAYHRLARQCIDALLATEPPTITTSTARRPLRVPSVCAKAAAASRNDSDGDTQRRWWSTRKMTTTRTWTSSLPPVIVFATDRGRSGGLGDRMRSIRNILMLSILTRRIFLINWQQPNSNPYSLTSAMHPSYIDWDLPHTTIGRLCQWYNIEYDLANENNINDDSDHHPEGGTGVVVLRLFPGVSYNLFHNPVNESIGEVSAVDTDFEELLKPFSLINIHDSILSQATVHALARNVPAKGKKRTEGLMNMTLLQLERSLTDFVFRPSPVVDFLATRRTFGETEENEGEKNIQQPYIAVHARTGEDVWESHDNRFVGLAEQFHIVAQRLLTCIARTTTASSSDNATTTTRVFFASDSLALKYHMVDAAARAGVQFNTNRRYTWHVDKMVNVHFGTPVDNCVGYLDVFADAFAVARANTVVFTPSNFPAVSMGLGGASVENWYIIDQRRELQENECMPMSAASEWNETKSSRAFVKFDSIDVFETF